MLNRAFSAYTFDTLRELILAASYTREVPVSFELLSFTRRPYFDAMNKIRARQRQPLVQHGHIHPLFTGVFVDIT
eukprot:1815223-Prorocentrum_lima.AAC.1